MVEIFTGRRFWVWLTVFGLIGFCAFSGLRIYSQFTEPYRGYVGEERFVDITPGSDAVTIARQLIAADIVRDRWVFRYAAWKTKSASRLQAGEYKFDSPMTAVQVLEKIMQGRVHLRTITFPEGLTLAQMAEIFGASDFGTREEFFTSVQNVELVAHFDKEATDLEGYLFPDTYALPRNATADHLVSAMVAGFEKKFDDELRRESQVRDFTLREVVTLASIIERETARADERTVVSGVFTNRLELGMLLQSDPTVIYALQLAGLYKNNLTRANLRFDSPYNTYLYAGLPPGPIASPGLGALKAAVQPDDVQYLYFVSRNDGSHVFATSLREHNRNVREFQVRYFQQRRSSEK